MTIQYTEKGVGLHDRIMRAGHWLAEGPDGWACSDEATVQAIIDGYTLDDAKADKCVQVSLHAKALRDKVVSNISPGEMASWSIKVAEANKYLASGNETDAPMLSAEAAARQITLAELVAKVGTNTVQFATLEAVIGGTDGRHRDAINALTTFEQVAAYDFATGWPEL